MADDDEINENEFGSSEETQIPENININVDESFSEGETEEKEENLEESEGGESSEFSSDFVPSSRFDSRLANPFLEAEPITNLEEDILGSPAQFAETRTVDQERKLAGADAYNVPQYSEKYKYDTEVVEERITPVNPSLFVDERNLPEQRQRAFDLQRWQQRNVEMGNIEGENYHLREPEPIKREDKLPFQQKKKLRF